MSDSEDPAMVDSKTLLSSAMHSASVAAEHASFALVALHELQRREAIADRDPTGGDAKQAPSRSDESGGAEGNRTNSGGHLLHKRSD